MKRNVKSYSDGFKLKVVEEYVSTDISYVGLQQKYGIGGNNNISRWMRKFGIKKPQDGELKIRRAMQEEKGKTAFERELEGKLKKAEKALEYERLRTLALNTLIDVAERDMKISIRKKHGAKQ